jgi:transglutaminase-like putative cysteine protease
MRKVGSTLIALVFVAMANAQSIDELRTAYPNANGVFLHKNERVTISVNDEGIPIVSIDNEQERLFLNENFKYYTEDEIGYSSFIEIDNIQPFVHIPNDGKYKKVKVKEIVEEDAYDESVFHDDYKLKTFFYAGLQNGGKTSLTYTERLTDPHFFGSFYFSTYLPVITSTYSIQTPLDMEIEFTMFGSDEEKAKISYAITTTSSAKIHTWTANNVPENKYEDGSVDMRYVTTHLQARIHSYTHNGERKHLLRDVSDLYSYYREFVNGVNDDVAPELKALADSITKGIEASDEKVKAIYYWVQDNIRYVAFEDGMGGFVPRNASLVCDRKYGDCKDMTSLLYVLINSVGVPAYYTWVGSRDVPYTYTDVPTPAVDNHMICTYFNGKEYVVVDGTGTGTIYGFPTSFIQGKQALIGLNDTEFKVIDIPIIDANVSSTIDTVYVRFAGNEIKGTAKVQYTGYSRIYLSDYVKNLSEKQRQEFSDESFKKGSNKSVCSLSEIRGLEDRESPLEMDYTFRTPEYTNSYKDEIYFNPFLKKYYSSDRINVETVKNPRDNPYKETIKEVVYIDIPDGYSVNYLPEGLTYKKEKFGCEVSLKISENGQQVVLETAYVTNYLILEPSDFADWNEMIKKLNELYSELIIFKEIN